MGGKFTLIVILSLGRLNAFVTGAEEIFPRFLFCPQGHPNRVQNNYEDKLGDCWG
eukprot:m.240995 g.240995  ORF g.240995 m.240995 type:complete len:55 (+) comp16084_c0_seq2:84-248(+)